MTDNKLSYTKGQARIALSEEHIGSFFQQIVREHAPHQALVSQAQNIRWSYAQVGTQVTQAMSALKSMRVQRGERIAVWSTNRAEWVVLQFACLSLGAILVHINPANKADELEYTLLHSGARLLFTQDHFRQFNALQAALQVKSQCPALESIIAFDEKADLSWTEFMALGENSSHELLQPDRLELLNCHDAASIQYTSGTTGKPKGATLSHHNMLNNAIQVGARLGLEQSDVICLPVPMFHCFGSVVGTLAAFAKGASIVLTGEGFDAKQCIQAVYSERCTVFYGVPMMYIAIMHHPEFDSQRCLSLKKGIIGASPCATEVFKEIVDKMHLDGLSSSYGMTENSPMATQSDPSDGVVLKSQTVGYVHDHLELKVIHPDGHQTLELGQTGELCIRGYSVMTGYWDNPSASAQTIDHEGWLHSGDLAVMRADGYVSIVGRIKDMVIRGGENIYPIEIEEFLHQIPQIAAAQVFGIPDELYGEQLVAWIVLKPQMHLDAAQMRELCKNKMASFKIPQHWKIVDQFPSTASGKAQKFKMRQIMIEELQLNANRSTSR